MKACRVFESKKQPGWWWVEYFGNKRKDTSLAVIYPDGWIRGSQYRWRRFLLDAKTEAEAIREATELGFNVVTSKPK